MPGAFTVPVTARHDWSREEIQALFEWPFMDLLFAAQSVHRTHFDPNAVQMSTLLSIKTAANAIFCGARLSTAPNPASARWRPVLRSLTRPAV